MSSVARRRELLLNLNAIDTCQMVLQQFFFMFFFSFAECEEQEMSVGRHSATSAAATVTSAQNRYWLPTILAPCSQISELALGYTVAMVRGLSAYGKKRKKRKTKISALCA